MFLRKLIYNNDWVTMAEFAESVGISRQYLSSINSGRNRPGYALAKRIGLRFGMKPGQFLDLYDKENKDENE